MSKWGSYIGRWVVVRKDGTTCLEVVVPKEDLLSNEGSFMNKLERKRCFLSVSTSIFALDLECGRKGGTKRQST